MMDPRNLLIQEYDYDLPETSIARYPLTNRESSKLLIYKNESIQEDEYANIHKHLPKDSLLIFNNTKVVAARLLFTKMTGGAIELFCLEPSEQYGDITNAMLQKKKVIWHCLVGGAKKWKKGEVLVKQIDTSNPSMTLWAKMIEKRSDSYVIELSWNMENQRFADILHLVGEIPLPPYLNRKAEDTDTERYQTVYAQHDGSVAAPTAGLHFTDALLQKLKKEGIHQAFVTLHVGAGTFKPVKSETLGDHEMHAEYIDVPSSLIQQLLDQSGKAIIPVGTTSFRTIESCYWMGVKATLDADASIQALEIKQWDVYTLPQNISVQTALQALLLWMQRQQTMRIVCKTQLLVTPAYTIRVADAIITNFHQPKSTLLLLIASFVGTQWKTIYQYALQHQFRFLSYGDGCLLWKRKEI